MIKQRHGLSGFSLIEILIVLVLLGFLALSTFSAVRATIHNKESIDKRTEILQEGRAVLAILERDISAAYFSVAEDFVWQPVKIDPKEPPDTPLPPPVKPLPVTIFKGSVNSIFFTSRTHRRMGIDSPENEAHFVTYQLSSGQLVRANSMRAVSVKDREDSDKFDSQVLLENIKTFKLAFYDPKSETWADIWDTEKTEYENRLPEAVKIELEYEPVVSVTLKVKPEPVVIKTEINITESNLKDWEIDKVGAGP